MNDLKNDLYGLKKIPVIRKTAKLSEQFIFSGSQLSMVR